MGSEQQPRSEQQPGETGETCRTCGVLVWAMGFRCSPGCKEDEPRVWMRRKGNDWEINAVWRKGGRYGAAPIG